MHSWCNTKNVRKKWYARKKKEKLKIFFGVNMEHKREYFLSLRKIQRKMHKMQNKHN